jgi:hypothetical protein
VSRTLGGNNYLPDSTSNKDCDFKWEDAVINAWDLVDYFKVQVQRVQAKIEKLVPTPVGANESRDIQEVLRWIEKDKRTTFQATELRFVRSFRGDHRQRDKILEEMEQRLYIRRLPDITLKSTKKPSPSYEVNQALRTWETTSPAPPEYPCRDTCLKSASDFRTNGTVASDPTHSGEWTSGEVGGSEPENPSQKC